MARLPKTGAQIVMEGLSAFLKGAGQMNKAVGQIGTTVNKLSKDVAKSGSTWTKEHQDMVKVAATSATEVADAIRMTVVAEGERLNKLKQVMNASTRNIKAQAQYAQTLQEIREKNEQAARSIALFGSAKAKELGLVIQNNRAIALAVLGFQVFKGVLGAVSGVLSFFTGLLGNLLSVVGGLARGLGGLVSGGISLLGRALKLLLSPLTGAISGLRQFWNRVVAVASGVLLRDLIFGLLRAFKELASGVFETAASLQTLQIRFENLLAAQARAADSTLDYAGSMAIAGRAAQGLLAWVKELGLQVPIKFENLADMTAYAMAMGFADEEAKRLTISIGNYSAGMGLASEVTERILFNFGQMRAAGKVTATEMRDLARGAFFPLTEVLDEAARQLGLTGESLLQFRELAAEGEIDIQTFFNAFEAVVARRFPDAMERFGRTIEGARVRLQNFFRVIVGGEALGPVVARIGEVLSDLADRLASPEIVKGAQLIGQVLLRSFEMVRIAVQHNLIPALAKFAETLGITGSFAENLAFVLAFVAVGMRKTINAIAKILFDVNRNVDVNLKSVADRAYQWGVNIMGALSAGLAAGVRLVVNVMVLLSQILAGWLKAMSPPKVAKDIDKWGAAAMTEYLKGFLKADWSTFNAVTDKLESYFRALPNAWGKDQLGLVPAILDMRKAVAQALSGGGHITDQILRGAKAASKEFRDYIQSLLIVEQANRRVEAANRRVKQAQDAVAVAIERTKAAQEAVSAIQDKYSAILNKLNAELRALTEEYEEQNRLAEIEAAIGTNLLTAEEKRRLETERRALQLKAQIRDVETQRDTEVSAAEKIVAAREAEEAALRERVAAAEESAAAEEAALEAAEARLEAAEALIDAQIKHNQLLSEYLQMLEKAAQGGGEGETPGTPQEPPPMPQMPEIGGGPGDLGFDIDGIFKKAEEAVAAMWGPLSEAITKPWEGMFGENGTLVTSLRTFSGNVKTILGGLFGTKEVVVAEGGAVSRIQEMPGLFDRLAEKVPGIVATFVSLAEQLPGLIGQLGTLGGQLDTLSGHIETLNTRWGELKTSWDNFKTEMGAITSAISSTWGTTFQIIGDGLAQLGRTLGLNQGEFEGWGKIIGDVIETVYKLFAWAFGIIIAIVTGAINGLIYVVQDFRERWTRFFEIWSDDSISIVTKLMAGIWLLISQGLYFVINFVEGFVRGVIGFFTDLYNQLVGNSIIPDLMDAIERIITTGLETVQGVWETIWNAVAAFLEDPVGTLIETFITGPLESLRKMVADTLTRALDTFRTNILTPLAAGFDSVMTAISNILEPLQGLIDKIKGFKPPEWFLAWIGHSPAPLAVGIKSVTKALRELQTSGVEILAGQISGPQVAAPQRAAAKDYSKIINIEINPSYSNTQSEASLRYDVEAALAAAAV